MVTPTPPRQQSGFVLVTALILMIVMTLLGVSMMNASSLDHKMSGFFRDRQLALQAAEAALRDSERDLLYSGRISGTMGFIAGCSSDGLCTPQTDGTPTWADLETAANTGWMTGANVVPSVQYGTYTTPSPTPVQNVVAQPRYIVEGMTVTQSTSLVIGFGPQSTTTIYRVTAVGFGRRTSTRVVLQAMYRL